MICPPAIGLWKSPEALDLPTSPLRIECFDISNLQGTEVVASMVVFEDGLPRKSEYRRFIIRHVDGQNDVAAMHEVITRRFRRLLDDRQSLSRGRARSDGEEGPLLIDPTTGARESSRTPRRWWWSTAVRPRSRPQPARWTSWDLRRRPVRVGEAPGGSVAAGQRRSGHPATYQRGSLSPPATARRGSPFAITTIGNGAVSRWSSRSWIRCRAWVKSAESCCSTTSVL